jgi:DNA helicase-2/ATP-dependent DNA helicase PcrA
LRAYEAASDIEEAGHIVDEVRHLQREGVALSDIALLYRSNAQSRVLEHALFSAGLSYRVYGGLRFFERQEVKHALAYLRLLANADDDGALLRVINFPARGIGNRSLEQLQEVARLRGTSLWAAACANTLGGKAGNSIAEFVRLIEAARNACADLPLSEIAAQIIEHSGLRRHYQNEKDGADRLENLDELVNACAAFAADERDDASLAAFLAHAALEAGEHQAAAGSEALQLMTVHAAKGLEVHSVFISGLEEGLFPHENSLDQDDGLEEERRLMYVALTRARRRLYLSHAQSRMLHGQTRYGIKSRFFDELPAGQLKWINKALQFPVRVPQSIKAGEAGAGSASPWRVGQNVIHPKFGSGVIVNAEGHGADARVQVSFRDAGVKWLALEYARLVPA